MRLLFLVLSVRCFSQQLPVAFSQDLDTYLGLSAQQVEEISKIKNPLDEATRARLARMHGLWKAVVDSISAPNLDPMRSGQPYAEALTIQAEDLQERALAANRFYGLLTPQQTTLIEALSQSQRLSSTAATAVCEKLVPPLSGRLGLFPLVNSPVQCLSDGLQNYMRQGTFPLVIPPPNLAKFLEISEEQQDRVNEIRRRFGIGDREERLFIQLSLFAAFSTRPPFDPMNLGTQLVGFEKLRREIRAITKEMVAEVRTVFTPEQVAKLESLEEARRLIRMEEEARCSGYLPRLEYPLPQGLYSAEVASPFANKAYQDCTSSGIRLPPE